MPTIPVNKFDGGQAEDVRTTQSDQNEKSLNFDVFTEPHRLIPCPDSAAETADVAMVDSKITDVGVCAISGTDYIVGIGYESSVSTATTFYTKTDPTAAFVKQASASGSSFVRGSGVTYKTFAYAVDDNTSGTYRLLKFTSAGTVTVIGSITATSNKKALTFVHPEDNVLYVVIDNVIATYNGSSFINGSGTTTLPTNYSATSVTNYGTYLAIVVNPSSGARKPICLLWGRDTTLNTFQGTIDLGEGYCALVENLDNNLVFVMSPYTTFSSNLQNKIIVKGYSGGSVQVLKEINDSSTISIGQVQTIKAKKNNHLYFATGNSDCVWRFGKNKTGFYSLVQDRYTINGVQISSTPSSQNVLGLSIIGDIMWVGTTSQTGTYSLQRTKINSLGESFTYTDTSTYRTTINPSMPIQDRYSDKQLEAVQISYTGAASGTTTLKYSVDGSTFTTIIAATNATGEHIVDAANDSNGDVFLNGREIQFQAESTGGSKIKEIRYRYKVLNSLT